MPTETNPATPTSRVNQPLVRLLSTVSGRQKPLRPFKRLLIDYQNWTQITNTADSKSAVKLPTTLVPRELTEIGGGQNLIELVSSSLSIRIHPFSPKLMAVESRQVVLSCVRPPPENLFKTASICRPGRILWLSLHRNTARLKFKLTFLPPEREHLKLDS